MAVQLILPLIIFGIIVCFRGVMGENCYEVLFEDRCVNVEEV